MLTEGVRKTELLHNGHFANAVVWRHWMDDGRCIVEKDFSSRLRLVRNTVGRFLIGREVRFIHAVESIGVAPGGVDRTGPFSMVEDYCDGVTLRQMVSFATGYAEQDGIANPPARLQALLERPTVAFFETLEEEVREVHRLGIVHLDLHNARNLIRTAEDHCILIDWQSALRTESFPLAVRRTLEAIDRAGIYKHWDKLCPGTLGPRREHVLDWETRARKYWVLHGLKIYSPPVKTDERLNGRP